MKTPEIIYEDNHILICLKPPGMLSQSDRSGDEDLLGYLKEYIKTSKGKPGNVYLALIHRLDRSTGGLMVFGKTSKAAARLSESFRQRKVRKKYLLLIGASEDQCLEKLGAPAGEIIDHYRKDGRKKMAVACPPDHPEVRKAILKYRMMARASSGANVARSDIEAGTVLSAPTAAESSALESSESDPVLPPGFVRHKNRARFSVVEAELLTGRFHQIRYQFGSRGLPLAGETKYGRRGLPDYRLGLWAFHLGFDHPTGDWMSFESWPEAEWWSHRMLIERK